MSSRQRREAFDRAVHNGECARRQGEPVTSNPYKKSSWGNGHAWEMGWLEADREANEIAAGDRHD